ncbi:MAG: TetR/AcrR family transcriptional regulator [Anaeromyxobacteraceae bacterium]
MPTVPKTSEAEILAEARRLVARDGAAAFSLGELAAAVGVKAPSLYKRFSGGREAILRGVAGAVGRELAERLLAAAGKGSLEARLRAVARAQRAFARREPRLYALVFAPTSEAAAPAAGPPAGAMQGLLALLGEWMGGGAEVLEGARLLVAFTHGFAGMEASGAFRLGGDVEAAFEFGLDRILGSLRGRKRAVRASGGRGPNGPSPPR